MTREEARAEINSALALAYHDRYDEAAAKLEAMVDELLASKDIATSTAKRILSERELDAAYREALDISRGY